MSEERAHAILSPSGADRWMSCLGSTLLTKDAPESTSEYAEEGTDYHELAAICLEEGTDAAEYIGHELPSGKRIVDEENAKFLQEGYINPVRAYALDATLLIEEECSISHLTGEPGAKGTADAVAIRTQDRELVVADLKFGRGVEVEVDHNRQVRIYALGVIRKHELEEVVDSVRLVILQPRTGDGKPREWVIPIQELIAFGEEVKKTSAKILRLNPATGELLFVPDLPLTPSEKACRFCPHKGFPCPALKNFVDGRMAEGFENLEAKTLEGVGGLTLSRAEVLGRAMDGINLIEIYMKGVQSQVEIELLAGKPVLGQDGPYKLVQGKKGNRKWIDEEEVEKLFKETFRLGQDDMYNKKLISPTDAEKLLAKDSPKRWTKVKKLYAQAEGGKHVANAKDPRPAIEQEKPEEGFETVSEADEFI
jgi:uncharacterized protein DUF2800